MFERSEGLKVTIGADITPYRENLKEASKLGAQFGNSITRAFEQAAIKGRNLGDVLKSLALSLSRSVFKAAFKPLESAVGNIFTTLFSRATPFAKGGVPGSVTPFASGGVISSPIAFPIGRKSLGLAGEAGAEAILPLARGADGRLGVRASSGNSPININFSVSTPDVEGFRRSESQIGAMLNRAVSRGSRNL